MPPPPKSPLTSGQIESVYNWISSGATNELCESPCDTSAVVTFSSTIWPVFETYCYGCHNGANAQKNQYLENYKDIFNIASNGKLIGVLTGQPGLVSMPPAGPLPDCQISQIEQWINNGTPNN